MTEFHKVEDSGQRDGADIQYSLQYKRTVKDINGLDVIIPAETHLKTEKRIQKEIDYWNAQKTNCDYQIAKLQKEITEISKIK